MVQTADSLLGLMVGGGSGDRVTEFVPCPKPTICSALGHQLPRWAVTLGSNNAHMQMFLSSYFVNGLIPEGLFALKLVSEKTDLSWEPLSVPLRRKYLSDHCPPAEESHFTPVFARRLSALVSCRDGGSLCPSCRLLARKEVKESQEALKTEVI